MDQLTPANETSSRFCQHCGIEVLDPPARCPLCGGVLGTQPRIPFSQLYSREGASTPLSHISVPNPGSRRFAASWIVILVYLVPGAVSILTDWLGNDHITWSGVVALSLLGSSGITVGGILLWPRGWLMNLGLWFWISLYLYLLNSYLGGEPWALGLGIPVTLLVGGVGTLTVYLLRAFKPGPFRSIGVFLFLVSLGLGGIEILIYRYLGFPGEILWSVITAGILGPLGIMFFAIHSLVQRTEGARKFFHW